VVVAVLLLRKIETGGDPESDVLLTTAKRHRIDAEKLQKAVAQEFAAKQKKKERSIGSGNGVA